MKKKTILKRRIHEECWDLDVSFYIWLNTRLKIYLKDASKVIDLNYRKFSYHNKTYTQKEVIERMIVLSDNLIKSDFLNKDDASWTDELLDLWKLVIHHMWW